MAGHVVGKLLGPAGLMLAVASGCTSGERHAASAAKEFPLRYTCRRVTSAPRIDGRLDDPGWAAAAWSDAFVDIEGLDKPPPRLRTRVKVLWGGTFLYVGALLEEPHVWGTLIERDSIVFRENAFEVFIDPDGDAQNYCEIEISARATVFDLLLVRTYKDGGPALHGWDCQGLRAAVWVDGTLNDPTDTDRSWSVEMAVPWEALGELTRKPVPPADGDVWRMNFARVQWQPHIVDGRYQAPPDKREGNWVWSPQGTVNMHLPQQWGFVAFSTTPVDVP